MLGGIGYSLCKVVRLSNWDRYLSSITHVFILPTTNGYKSDAQKNRKKEN